MPRRRTQRLTLAALRHWPPRGWPADAPATDAALRHFLRLAFQCNEKSVLAARRRLTAAGRVRRANKAVYVRQSHRYLAVWEYVPAATPAAALEPG